MRWRRGPAIPEAARAALDLRPGERLLAAARDTEGGWLAATDLALVAPDVRIAWADVSHARWLDEGSILVVEPVPGRSAPRRFELAEPGRVPETVHERVMASIVVSRRVGVPGGGGVRVVGREDGSGHLLWQVVPDPGVDVDDPDVRRVADASVAQLRGELGR